MREIKFRAWNGEKMLNHLYFHVTPKGFIWYYNSCTEGVRAIMQFTGLRDRNKNEIYEGDIVKCGRSEEHSPMAVIVFEEQSFLIEYLPLEKKKNDNVFSHMEGYKYFKVIGNIYENPELLKL